MHVLLLGHTGFLGKNILKYCLSKKITVTRISSKECDLKNYNEVFKCFKELKEIDLILNCAANVGSVHYVTKHAAEVITENSLISINIYKATQKYHSLATIVNPLGNCAYPSTSTLQKEDEWLNGEVHKSVFAFGNFKRFLYYLSKSYKMEYDLKSINLIYPNIFGPGDSNDPHKVHALNGMIIRMLEAQRKNEETFEVWGTGKPIREWLYIDDACKTIVDAFEILNESIEPINIAQGKGYSISETAQLIAKGVGFKGEIVFNNRYQDGDPIKILDNTLFSQRFNNHKFVDHYQGIIKTINYYKNKYYNY